MTNDWQYLAPMGIPQPGTPVVGGGGRDLTGYRDILDAKRSVATPRTPNAEYPDGYLGNVHSRRDDRILNAVKGRLTERSYQRGVHKGEKLDMSDYFWPPDFNPQTALAAEAQGRKWGAVGSTPVEQINHMGKNHMVSPEQMTSVAASHDVKVFNPLAPEDAKRFEQYRPTWR